MVYNLTINMKKLLVASKNQGKIKEFKNILTDFKIISLLDLEFPPDVIEDGSSFRENAVKKAVEIFNFSKTATAADDSGLEIDYLDKKPGVHSARFLGDNVTDFERNKKIIELLKNVPFEQRTARFRCELAYKDEKILKIFSGTVEGKIAYEIKGSYGFGYDPVFIPDGYNKTFGELGKEIKDRISHRAKALKKFSEWIKQLD